MQPVRLVLLIIDGSQEGENDFIEFPSMEAALAHGRELYGERRVQLEAIEDVNGKLLLSYDHLNELCSAPLSMPERRYG